MKNPYKGGGGDDNYKPLSFYEARSTGVENGFDSFADGGEFYFTFNSGGDVYMISEGYSSDNGRDNGINSVRNNMTIEARYQRMVHPNGKHYFNLRAGNNQNIATSRWFDSLAGMNTVIGRLVGGQPVGGQRTAEGAELTAANRVANIAIAAPPPPTADDDKPKKRKKRRSTGEKKPKKEKVYVANGKYLFNDITWDIFKSGNDRFYFTFKNPEGKTIFLNADVRGFETQEAAQTVLDQIMLYAPYEANYQGKPTKNGKYFFYIMGAEGKKIGKSFFYGSTDDMQAAIGTLLGSEVQRAAAAAPSRDGSAATDKKTDDYLAPPKYTGAVGFHTFEEDGEYYFSYNGANGETLLRSEGYSSTAARDNGISSVTKNAPLEARWSTGRTPAGKYYYALKAGNHQEIGQSKHYDSEEQMLGSFNWVKGGESAIGAGSRMVDGVYWSAYGWKQKEDKEAAALAAKKAAEEAAAKKAAEEAAAKKAADEAAAKKAAAAAAASAAAALAAKKAADEAAARKAAEEEATRKREAEATARKKAEEEAARKRATEEAAAKKKAEEAAARKKKAEEEEATRLRAEIAAAKKKEEEEATRLKAEIAAARKAEEEAAAKKVAEAAAKKKAEAAAAEKTRLAAVAASAAAVTGAAATVSSKKEEAPVDEEDDYLPCREYKGHNVNDAQNNVALFKHDNGQFYFSLYDSNGNVRLRSEGFQSAKERDQELSGVLKFKDDQSLYKRKKKGKYYMDILYDKSGREVGRSCLMKESDKPKTTVKEAPKKVEVKKEEAKPSVAKGAVAASAVGLGAVSASSAVNKTTTKKVVVERTIDEEDDYLPCKEYEGHTITDKKNNIALFKHKNGQYYFVQYADKGKVKLRSEGFKTTADRDDELKEVIKLQGDKSMYKRKRKGNFFMDILYDKSGREIGRSCLEKEQPKVVAKPKPVAAAATVATAAAAATVVTKKRSAPTDDDYLICKEYKGHKVTDKKNNVALFKHKNDKYYFAVYDNKGEVKLRSEGFENAKTRDDELRGVLKNIKNKDRYKRVTRGNVYYDALYDNNKREVGRSCLQKKAAPVPVAAKAAPVAKKVVAAPAAKAAAATTAASSGGGFPWWLLLFLIPLLLGLLWFLLRGCEGDTPPPPPAKMEVAPVKKEVPPPPPPAPTCACNGMDGNVFSIPSASQPKVLTRLGTNPEFGYVRDLGKDAFLAKLAGRHKASSRDRQFLDGVCKSLGYANGFSDLTADNISSVRIAPGTVGNIGAGTNHRTVYAKLDVSGRDVEAFRIEGPNACAIHFMKTCGNHFYYCE